jgi:hypothetical protein
MVLTYENFHLEGGTTAGAVEPKNNNVWRREQGNFKNGNRAEQSIKLRALPQTPDWGEPFKAPSRLEQAEPAGGSCNKS